MKDKLIDLIMRENVSAIETMANELETTSEEVIEILSKLVESGDLSGLLTEDCTRFYKSTVKLSGAPKIEREEKPPSFMTFNTKPAIAIASVGFLLIAAGVIVNAFAADIIEQNFAAVLILFGLIIAMSGLYCFSQRKTPA